MRVVSRFEADLLQLVAAMLGQAPASHALPLLLASRRRPAGLGKDAMELLQDMLAKGCVRLLASEGWRPERFLREGQGVSGPVWRRTAPEQLGFTFSPATVDFLLWASCEKTGEAPIGWRPPLGVKLTVGDLFVLFLAYQAVRTTDIGARWRRRKPFVDHGLCWLAFPEDFAEAPSGSSPNFAPWLTGVGAIVLETWQRRLAARWVEAEQHKQHVRDAVRIRRLGRAQDKILAGLFAEAERVGRRDLTLFLMLAARSMLSQFSAAGDWLAHIDVGDLTTGERFDVYRESTALLLGLLVLRQWRRLADTIGYVDEGYAAAQYWKAEWERLGAERLCEAAEAIVRQADPRW